MKPLCKRSELAEKCEFVSTSPFRNVFFTQVVLDSMKQRGAYSMLKLISVRSKQEDAKELSEDMLGATLLGGHASGEAGHFRGLGDLMGPGECGPGTVRKMVPELFFFPKDSQNPLGSEPVSWGMGSVVTIVALVADMELLEVSLVSEAGSGGHGKFAGHSPWDGALGSWLVSTFLMNRGPFFKASGPVYGLPISRSSTRRNCKQMTGLWAGPPTSTFSSSAVMLISGKRFLPDYPTQWISEWIFPLPRPYLP